MPRFSVAVAAAALVVASACGSSTSHKTTSSTTSAGGASTTTSNAASFTAPAPANCPAVTATGSATTAPAATAPPAGTVEATISAPRSPQFVTTGDGSVWVVTHRTLDVWRVDPGTNRATDIPYQTNHGDAQVFDVSVGPDGVFAVVGLDDVVDRVDAANKQLVSLATIQGATSVVDTPSGLWAGVRGGQGRGPVDALVKLDPTTGKELTRVTVGNGGRLEGSGLTMVYAVGSLWVQTDDNDTLIRVDPQSAKVVAAVKLPAQPVGLGAGPSALYAALDPAVASGSGSLQVARIDAQTNCTTAMANFGPAGASSLFVAASADAVYASYGKGALAVLDPQSLAVRKAYHLDDQQFDGGLAVDFGSVWYTTFDKDNLLRVRP